MGTLSATFSEEARDFRTREAVMVFSLKNSLEHAIRLVSTEPRLPDGVELIETREFALLSTKEKHSQLCGELEELANDIVEVENAAFQSKLIEIQRRYIQELLKHVSGWLGIFRLYWSLFSGQYERRLGEIKRRSKAFRIEVESSRDAEAINELFVSGTETPDELKSMFAIKLDKLKECEASLGEGNDVKTAAIATVEAGSEYTARYLFRFPRNVFESGSFSVSVTAAYTSDLSPTPYSTTASATACISPHPLSLSSVSVVAAILGVILNNAVTVMGSPGMALRFHSPTGFAEGVAAAILAFVVFNVYEFTDMFESLRSRLSWRHALFIGIFCGAGVQRVFNVFDALIGTNTGG